MRPVPGQCHIKVARTNVFEDSYNEIMRVPVSELKKRLMIKFDGEDGLDYGGVSREYFFLLSHEIIDAEVYRSLKWILDNDVTDMGFTFSVDDERFGEHIEVDLKPGGSEIDVTEENKEEFIQLRIKYRVCDRIKDQFEAFQAGFHELIPEDLVQVFDERELELLIGGLAEIDMEDWKKHTDYRGYTESDQVVQWFWKFVKEMDSEHQTRLLQFTTGTSRIPVNGFKDLQGSDGPRRFTIEKSGDILSLPKSHTCFNRIDLPPYPDYETLSSKLTLAIENTVGFAQE
ncbi:hypothetical protein GGI05_004586 [Coemansia sp. RSA 2603]|nr:hypothetical protein GGI05_004586 [Coemansia sp. RSA 2603]